jgi:predicted transposase/invertase (TIGR01784 family)
MKSKPKKKSTLHNPHDKALFHALKNHKVARDAMRAFLPSELLLQSNLDQIRMYKTKLVSPEYKEFEADIIYEIEMNSGKGLFLFHCELQSTVAKDMPLRVWQYLLLVLMEYTENHPKLPLPLVYPIIIYTGEKLYSATTNFFELFATQKDLAKQFLLQDIRLIDVCRMADEDIQKHRLFGLTEFAFKYKATQNFRKFLEVLMPWLHEVECELGSQYAKIVLKYVVNEFSSGNYEQFTEVAQTYLSKELGEDAMTIAQQLREEGRLEGRLEGELIKEREIAKRMLESGSDSTFVVKVTGLSLEQIKELQKH